MVRGSADEVVGYTLTRGASGVTIHVGFLKIRTLHKDLTRALTFHCRRSYADDSHRYSREVQGKNLRPDPRCLYIGLDLTACPQLQLDRLR